MPPLDDATLAELEKAEAAMTLPWLPGYELHADGTIWSVSSNWRGYGPRKLTPFPDAHGYGRVKCKVGDGMRTLRVHKLMAEAFLPARPTRNHEIRHLDGDSANNAAANLAWGTAAENAEDREEHGRTARGERHGRSRLTSDMVREIPETSC